MYGEFKATLSWVSRLDGDPFHRQALSFNRPIDWLQMFTVLMFSWIENDQNSLNAEIEFWLISSTKKDGKCCPSRSFMLWIAHVWIAQFLNFVYIICFFFTTLLVFRHFPIGFLIKRKIRCYSRYWLSRIQQPLKFTHLNLTRKKCFTFYIKDFFSSFRSKRKLT